MVLELLVGSVFALGAGVGVAVGTRKIWCDLLAELRGDIAKVRALHARLLGGHPGGNDGS